MNIIGVIPARYASTRFPGKPLADICGKPMIRWVYGQVKKVKEFSDVYVATDDKRIAAVCEKFSMKYIMTSADHGTSTERVYEVAQKVAADYYVVINGDEPLIDPNVIRAVIPKVKADGIYVGNLITEIRSPAEAVDFTNIKVVTDADGNALYMSRSPIPYPKSSIDYVYYKHLGVLVYTLAALKFFSETPKGYNEGIEDVNELRFIEHGVKVKMTKVQANSLSVDTIKDLEHIRRIAEKKGETSEELF